MYHKNDSGDKRLGELLNDYEKKEFPLISFKSYVVFTLITVFINVFSDNFSLIFKRVHL